MANQNILRNIVRIPNLPTGPVVDENGMPTDQETSFRQALLALLETFLGDEGLVMPSQDAADVTIIQNHTEVTPAGTYGTPITTYTCAYGTMLYEVNDDAPTPDPLKDEVVVAVNDGATPNKPVFRQVFLLEDVVATAGAITDYGVITLNGTQYKIALYALV
jgi:hypothetical protein